MKHASSTDSYILKHYSFQEYAEKYISNVDFEFIINSCGYSGQLKNMNMYDAYRLFSEGIRDDVKFFLGNITFSYNIRTFGFQSLRMDIDCIDRQQ